MTSILCLCTFPVYDAQKSYADFKLIPKYGIPVHEWGILVEERLSNPVVLMQEYSKIVCDFIDFTFDKIQKMGEIELDIDSVLYDDFDYIYSLKGLE
jgi:hypothetical protein